MDLLLAAAQNGEKPTFPPEADTLEYAKLLDSQDKISHLRDQFNIPTKGSLLKKALDGTIPGDTTTQNRNSSINSKDDTATPSIYFVGNSLGAQPKSVQSHVSAQLETWASIGVNGHFTSLGNSPLSAWQDLAESCAEKSMDLVGAASPQEVIYMNTLTVNLHLMLAAFYRPTAKRHKIIIEWRPFPSDWYAVQSQIALHGFGVEESLVEIQPDEGSESLYLSTERILAAIEEHADTTAVLLLPGVQYFTGQVLDIPTITRYAQQRGIVVGWDLAHAAGNIPLRLHDWGVDFAVWCTYKYLNAGPGATAGLFLHEKHHDKIQEGQVKGRLAGWYGADKRVRFNMEKEFVPSPGAWGYQLSNPSGIDLSCLSAALSVFGMTGMNELRGKSVVLTGYLEWLLLKVLAEEEGSKKGVFRILTPERVEERGAQLSLMFKSKEVLERVGKELAEKGVVFDVRRPDVIRVAPVPLYCSFEDVWRFVELLKGTIAEF